MKIKSIALGSFFIASALVAGEPSVKLNLYNGFGQVSEPNSIKPQGRDIVFFEYEIPSTIEPKSVSFKSENAVLRTYAYNENKVSLAKLLEERLGKRVRFFNVEAGEKNRTIIEGTLMSVDPIVIKDFGDKIYTHIENRNVIIEDIPKHLHAKPNLELTISPLKKAKSVSYSLGYIAKGLGCVPSYNVFVDGIAAELRGYLELRNKTNKSFENASVSCVLGNVSKHPPEFPHPVAMKKLNPAVQGLYQGYKDAAEYEILKISKISYPVDLKGGSTRSVPFLDERNLYAKFENRFEDSHLMYGGRTSSRFKRILKVGDPKGGGLDSSLASGTVRVYEKIAGEDVFVGEETIGFVPEHKDVRVLLGESNSLFVDVETKIVSTAGKEEKQEASVVSYKETVVEKSFSVRNSGGSKEDFVLSLKVPSMFEAEVLSGSCAPDSCSVKKELDEILVEGVVEGVVEVRIKYRIISNKRELKRK